jgi:hypothetical protein
MLTMWHREMAFVYLVLPTRSVMMTFPFLVCVVLPPPRPSAPAAATLPADRDEEVPIPCLPHRTALVSCDGDAEIPLSRPSVSCLSSSPPIVHPQPASQAGGRGRCPFGYD